MKKTPHVCILQTSFAKRDDTIEFLKERVPGVNVAFITDSTLLADVRAAGGPTESVIERMRLYAKAAEISGADLIVNSCSTVGEVAEIYRQDVSIPVMRVDEPMAKAAAFIGGKIALVATVETTLGPSRRLIERYAEKYGKTVECEEFLETAAFRAIAEGDAAEHNRILIKRFKELDTMGFDVIVMVQVSMRALLPELKKMSTPVLNSFESGYQAVADRLLKIAEASD